MADAGGKALAGAVPAVIHRVVDIIRIAGIKSFGHHGALPEEKRLGQRFTVSVDLEVDTRPAAAADDLKLTVDYAEVIRTVEAQLTGKPVYLIETLAQQIAARILGTFPVVKAVTVEVTKPFAPVAAEFEGHGDILDRRHRRDQMEGLEDDADRIAPEDGKLVLVSAAE